MKNLHFLLGICFSFSLRGGQTCSKTSNAEKLIDAIEQANQKKIEQLLNAGIWETNALLYSEVYLEWESRKNRSTLEKRKHIHAMLKIAHDQRNQISAPISAMHTNTFNTLLSRSKNKN